MNTKARKIDAEHFLVKRLEKEQATTAKQKPASVEQFTLIEPENKK